PRKASRCPQRVISDRSIRQRRSRHVRFAPKADKRPLASLCPLSAKRGLMHRSRYPSTNRSRCSKNKAITAEKVPTGFAQPCKLVVPFVDVFRWKIIRATDKIPDEAGQTFAVGIIVPLNIEDRKDTGTIKPKTCADQLIGQRSRQTGMGTM